MLLLSLALKCFLCQFYVSRRVLKERISHVLCRYRIQYAFIIILSVNDASITRIFPGKASICNTIVEVRKIRKRQRRKMDIPTNDKYELHVGDTIRIQLTDPLVCKHKHTTLALYPSYMYRAISSDYSTVIIFALAS